MFDVWVMIIAGVCAFLMKKSGFPMAPIVLAFVLGPIFEIRARQALEISNCNLMIFLEKPISLAFILVTVAVCLAPVIMKFTKKKKSEEV